MNFGLLDGVDKWMDGWRRYSTDSTLDMGFRADGIMDGMEWVVVGIGTSYLEILKLSYR